MGLVSPLLFVIIVKAPCFFMRFSVLHSFQPHSPALATYTLVIYMVVCQNLVPLVNIKIAGKWMFIPLKMVLIGIDP